MNNNTFDASLQLLKLGKQKNRNQKYSNKILSVVITFIMILIGNYGWGQQSIVATGSANTQAFSIGTSATASLPTGFKIGTDWSSGTTATTVAYGSTGTGAVTGTSGGGAINWANGITGSSTERSIGFLSSGSYSSPRSIVYAFTNNTGSTITSIDLSWNYEKYRSGSRAFAWTFFHGSTSTASTAATSGDLSYPADANNTVISNPPLSSSKSFTISGLSIANGATYYLRWTYTGSGGNTNAQGLGIDDFSITLNAAAASPTISTTGTPLSAVNTTYGTNSSNTTFSVSGATMTEGISVTPPAGFQVSTVSDFSSNVGTNSSPITVGAAGTIASTTIYVRIPATTAAGTYSGNIVLASSGATSVNVATISSTVSTKNLTITGLSASNKVYNGTTAVSVAGTPAFSGLVNGDSFSPTGSVSWEFPNANVGNGKTLTRTGSYSDPSANYNVTQPSLTADITAKALTITANDVSKPQGTTLTDGAGSTAFSSSGLENGETIGSVTLSYGSAGAATGDGNVPGVYPNQVTPSLPTGGTFSSSNYSISYVLGTITVTVVSTPTLNVSALTDFGNQCIGTCSAEKSFTITGSSLTSADVEVTALSGYTICATAGGTYTSSLTFTQGGGAFSQTVYVKFCPAAEQAYNGNIVVSGGGASSENVAVTGVGINTAPTVTAGAANSITNSSATIPGTITFTGCTAISAYGIEYSTSSGFANGSGTQVAGSNLSGGNFSVGLSGLNYSTTYYFKTFATNGGGTSYSAQGSFITLTPTISVETVTAFSNQCINTTSSEKSYTVSGSNLVANISISAPSGFEISTTSGAGFGNTVSLTQSGGTVNATTIYIRFIPTAVQAYSGDISHTSTGATAQNVAVSGSGINTTPTVSTTSPASSIDVTSATCSGIVTAAGCQSITARGICYGTSVNPDITGSKTTEAGTTGAFSSNISGLTENTLYHFRAYATSSAGTSYGTDVTFTTLKSAPTTQASSITFSAVGSTSMTVSWTNGNGGKRVVIMNTSNSFTNPTDGTEPSANTIYSGSGEQVVYNNSSNTVAVSGLTASTTYWFRVYEYNNTGANTKYNTSTATDNPLSQATTAAPCGSESFSSIGTSTSYGTRTWTGDDGGSWSATDAREDQTITGKAITVRTGVLTSPTKSGGIGDLSFKTKFPFTESSGTLTIAVNGSTVGTVAYADMNGTTPITKTITGINVGGDVVVTITSASARFSIDDLSWTCFVPDPEPEINLKGNNSSIASGSVIPALGNHTDFGNVDESSGTLVRTFTIENTGTADLNLTSGSPYVSISGANAGDFSVTAIPSTPITSTSSTTFQITFNPSSTGTRSATISIANDDSDENPYTFAIQGTGVNSVASDIIADATFSYSSNIDYTSYQGNPASNTSNSVGVFKFTLRDGGGSADSDALTTELNSITFNVTNIANVRSAALFGGGSQTTMINNTPTINTGAGTISFTGLSGVNVTADDDGTKNITLRISFLTTVTDNQQLQFTISSATSNSSGSSFASANAGGAVSSTTGDINRIEVTATTIAWQTQPTSGSLNNNLVPFTIKAVDVNGNIDIDNSTCSVAITTSGVDFTVTSPVTMVSGVVTVSDAVYSSLQTGITITATAQSCLGNTAITSDAFNISGITYVVNDYRSKEGTGLLWGDANHWQMYNGTEWNDLGTNGIPAATRRIYIQGEMSTNGSRTASEIIIMSGGVLTVTASSTATNKCLVKDGGKLVLNALLTNPATTGNFIVEDNGTVHINNASSGSSALWSGTEDFKPNSTLVINKWDATAGTPELFAGRVTLNTYNGYTAAFGNISIDFSTNPGGNFILIEGGVNTNLAHGNLRFISSPTAGGVQRSISIGATGNITTGIGGSFIVEDSYTGTDFINFKTSGNLNFTIKGDMQLNAATTRIFTSSLAGSSSTINVEGDLIISPSAVIDFNSTSAGGSPPPASILNLKGDLTVAGSGLLQNTNSSSLGQFNFNGTGDGLSAATTQTIDIASTSGNENKYIAFSINSGAYVQLINRNLELGTNSGVTVKDGGVFDFGFSGTTPLNVTISGSMTGTYFTTQQKSTLKITSVDGISTTGAVGNVQVVASNRTFNQLATFHYIGKSPAQVTGNAITTGSSGKIVIVEMDDNATTLTLTNGTGITNATTIDPLGGKLEIRKGTLISSATNPITSTGRLIMTDGTYKIAELTTVPQLTGNYTLTGGTIELNGGAGTQTLRGSMDYYNLTFSGGGTKNISIAITDIGDNSTINQGLVTIKDDNTVLDIQNSGFSGNAGLTMTDNSTFRSRRISASLPELDGFYTLTGGTIELYGSGATQNHTLRGTDGSGNRIIYNNVELNADAANVANNDANIIIGAGFTVKGSMNVNSPTCLRVASTYNIDGVGAFNVNSGATLKYGSADGITASSNAGNIRTSTRNFSNTASYGFAGTLNQVTGDGLPTSVVNIYMDKTNPTSTVTLTNPLSIQNTLVMNQGHINSGSNLLELGSSTTDKGTLTYTTGYVIGKMRRWFNGTNSGNSTGLFPIAISQTGLKNRNVLIEYTSAAAAGGSLTVEWVGTAMGTAGLPISAANSGGCTFDVTSASNQGYWKIDNSVGTLTDGEYTISLTGESINTITDLSKLTLLKRVGTGNWLCPGTHNAPAGSISNPSISRAGVSGWSNFGFGGGDPNALPIELNSFAAKCQNDIVKINWSTASEINNSHFVLQRSMNDNDWSDVAIIRGQGNSTTLNKYSYTDKVFSQQVLYRLIQVDFDGQSTNFGPIAVRCFADDLINDTKVYPNPFNQELNIVLSSNNSIVELIDINGKIIYSEKYFNQSNIQLSLTNLHPGIYSLRIITDDKTEVIKVVKQ